MPLSAFTHVFAGSPLDRAAERRGDAAWLAERTEDSGSISIALCRGKPLVVGEPLRAARLPMSVATALQATKDDPVFLGTHDGAAVFAVELEDESAASGLGWDAAGRFVDLRLAAPMLDAGDAAMFAAARSLLEWRRNHAFCARCGQRSVSADAGWKRACPACRAEHFPRTDPVAIMLPVCGERCLLGRGPGWPEGRFSSLAGFVEPGESVEEACARELKEEAGLTAIAVTYHSSQPWPFPSQLMIGLIAEVAEGEAAPDQTELEAVRWFTRAEANELLAGSLEGLTAPPTSAIAHWLIRSWAECRV